MISPLSWIKYQYHGYRGARFAEKRNYKEALRHLNQALEFNPQGWNGLMQRAYANFALGNLDQAHSDLSQALAIKQSVYLLRLQGSVYYRQKDFKHAIESFDAGLILEPYDDWLSFERGHAYRQLGNHREAVLSFQNAVKFRPDTQHYLELARAQVALGLWDDALKTWDDALKMSGHIASIYLNRGEAYLNHDDNDLALADLMKAIELAEKENNMQMDCNANYFLGLLYQLRFKDYDKALACYMIVLQISPKDIATHLNRAWIYIKRRDYDAALVDTDIVLAQKQSKSALNYKGFILAQKGEFEQAFQYFEQGIALDPKDALPYSNLASLYLKQNRLPEALTNAEQGYTLQPKEPATVAYLAIVHDQLGNHEKTAELWAELLKTEPKYNNAEWIKSENNWADYMVSLVEQTIAYVNDKQRMTDN